MQIKEISPVILSLVAKINESMEIYEHASNRFTEEYNEQRLHQLSKSKRLHIKEIANIFEVDKQKLIEAVQKMNDVEVEKEKLNFNNLVDIDDEESLWKYFIEKERSLIQQYNKILAEQKYDEFQQAIMQNHVAECKREKNELQKHAEIAR